MLKLLYNCTHLTHQQGHAQNPSSLASTVHEWTIHGCAMDNPDVQAGFRKGRGTRNSIANICLIIEKAREFQKNIYFWFKAFNCVDHNKLLKIQEMGIPDHLTCLLRSLCMLVAQSCLTLCNRMDCNPPVPSVHGIFQARILEWVAITFSTEICMQLKKQQLEPDMEQW